MKKADKNKPAVTMYPKSVKMLADYNRKDGTPNQVLKQSKNAKLSKDRLPVIKKGKFKGYVIYTLTLQERATCPRSCYHWDNCYGNNMMFAHRLQHGSELEQRIKKEIEELCGTYKGVIVRLHVLGDFYSELYVMLWGQLLAKYNNLAIWGFTGHAPDSVIGKTIGWVHAKFRERFSVRYSNAPTWQFSANSADLYKPEKNKSIVCPEQTGAAESCATCTLCWSAPEKQILFVTH